jgi:hypothetical protein
MSTSVVCIDTVGSDTATVIIRIQEVTNVRVLPPFSVFPAVAPALVAVCVGRITNVARPTRRGGGSSGERGRPRAGRVAPSSRLRRPRRGGRGRDALRRRGGLLGKLLGGARPRLRQWPSAGASELR